MISQVAHFACFSLASRHILRYMAFTAAAVANRFLTLAWREAKTITPLKMQKLVYFAHGWHLALFGKPLMMEPIQAWRFGPVIGSLYRLFREFGSEPITQRARVVSQDGYIPALLANEGTQDEVSRARAVIGRVWKEYGRFTASQLTTLTHSEDSPWSKVPNKERAETQIPNDLIKSFFLEQIAN